MGVFTLTFHDFLHIFGVCQAVPLNGSTCPALVRKFLVSQLFPRCRETAAKVAAFDDQHIRLLAREVAAYFAHLRYAN